MDIREDMRTCYKKQYLEAREQMGTQVQLSALTWPLITVSNSSSRISDVLFRSLQVLDAHGAQTY
ncbi:hypothetical protein STEG23_010333, partial [Scotinomys teguina]